MLDLKAELELGEDFLKSSSLMSRTLTVLLGRVETGFSGFSLISAT